VVTVTATPASGYAFSAWTGALSGATNPATVTMDADKTVGATFTAQTGAECDKPANVARRAALVASQPALAVHASSGKTVKTFTTTFASVADDPTARCEVQLQFKDLSDDDALQPYEDWTLTAGERAADLAGRMTKAQKLALMAHAAFGDSPTTANPNPSAASLALVTSGVRFGLTAANAALPKNRAAWANALQAAAEASAFGIPFVLSMEPAHSAGNGRVVANGFSSWPAELAFGAADDLGMTETFGNYVAQEYRAIGVTMAISPNANLATDPRWYGSQFTFGDDSARVSAHVGAFVKGLQRPVQAASDAATGAITRPGVAVVLGHFPGAGPAKDGWDARLQKGRFYSYPGGAFDAHANVFAGAFENGVAAVMPGYGIPEQGSWTGLGGVLNGATIEQVGAAFNSAIVTDALRGHFEFDGLVVAPAGVLENAGIAPLGAPWGVEGLTKPQRIAKAVGAGVDQFMGLADTVDLTAANLTDAQVDAAATRALALIVRLGLFENPYVNGPRAAEFCSSDAADNAALAVQWRSVTLLLNNPKPAGFLNGEGDGTQVGDPGNAGNGTRLVLPAAPGKPYIAPGSDYYIAGDFDLDYVRSVSSGYGVLTNDLPEVNKKFGPGDADDVIVQTPTQADRMAAADYIFIRIAAPYSDDPDSGAFHHGLQSLQYSGNDASVLAPLAAARAAITAWNTATPPKPVPSQAQIIVTVDAGRPAVMSELLAPAYGVSGLYLTWLGTMPQGNEWSDKVLLDVAFGIVNGSGKLPVGLAGSDAAAAAQHEDVAGDGADATFLRGFGIETTMF